MRVAQRGLKAIHTAFSVKLKSLKIRKRSAGQLASQKSDGKQISLGGTFSM